MATYDALGNPLYYHNGAGFGKNFTWTGRQLVGMTQSVLAIEQTNADGDTMNLNINSPAYYSQMFGIIEEVYRMCSCIEKNIDIKKYTSKLDTIETTSIIAPDDVINKGL